MEAATDASEACTVHIRFAPSQGRRLQRSEPTPCGEGRPLWTERPLLIRRANGMYDLIGTTRHLDGLARWILSFGVHAQVRSPNRLRRRVAAEARRIVRLYDEERNDEERT